ncbi:DMT family transporter [Nocardioides sp. S-58]|uniref:DMT family transporter n=1 Tax=Nocardioides renjunii TaxID=3095075 RepID=A0ABU5KAX4_9ACTN|nr:DMT family transporter [Nocardioides sp. S-58]MDZ5661745.1 DMT family transporter [Nocardioides sp. S-58]
MGPLACLLSAVAFGVMAVFAKLAYDDGVTLEALLLVRFGVAGALLLTVAGLRRRFRGTSRRAVVAGLLMGAVGYAAQAGLYFGALTRVDASQVALVFCVYPLLVMVAAVLTGRERASRTRGAALAVALLGVALVLGGASADGFDTGGAALALGSAVVYSVYILVGDRVAAADPLAFAALVCCGAFGTFAVWSAARGVPDLTFPATGWLWLLLIALVSTVAAIVLFFFGLARVGPTVASILSIVEPVVTVTGAALVFGESLSVRQACGGLLVLWAVAIVQWPRPRAASPAGGGPGRTADPVPRGSDAVSPR